MAKDGRPELMTHERKIAAPDGAPRFGWTKESIKAHFTQNPPQVGDKLIIYNSQYGFHRYQLATVVNPAGGRQKRIILSKSGFSGGTSFHRSGINTFAPKGRTSLLPPVPALMEHLADDCDVVLDLMPHAPLPPDSAN